MEDDAGDRGCCEWKGDAGGSGRVMLVDAAGGRLIMVDAVGERVMLVDAGGGNVMLVEVAGEMMVVKRVPLVGGWVDGEENGGGGDS